MAGPHLTSRPKTAHISVEDLVQDIQDGALRVPPFQRPLRWRANEVRNLFDSIWHGYPVGSLLFWQREAPAEVLRMGDLVVNAPARTDARYAVDGQQRITSLACVLLHPHPTRSSKDIFALWFDLESERFAGPADEALGGPTWIPLNVVLDAVELQTWWADQVELHERVDLFRKALLLGKRVREYQIPSYIVDSGDQQVLQVIFTRLNSAGVAMRLSEVFRALHLVGEEDDPVKAMRLLVQESGLGTWNDEALVQALRVGASEDLATPMKLEVGSLRAHLDQSLAAVSLALEFFRDDIGLPHIRLLPSRFPFLVLVRYFLFFPTPPPRARILLRRWFWRGVISGRLLNMNNPRLRAIQKLVIKSDTDSLVALLGDAGCPTEETIREFAQQIPRAERRANAVEERIGLIVLASLKPLEARSGSPIDVGQLTEAAGAAALGSAVKGDWRVIHPRIDGLAEALAASDPEIQASHAWGPDRVEVLATFMADFLVAACEPGQSDHPPLGPALDDLDEE